MIGVYIARDADGRALYVGSSGRISSRLATHQKSASWWALVDSVEQIECGTRALAYRREDEFIKQLNPPHNVRGVGAPKVKGRAVGPAIRVRHETFADLIEAFGSVAQVARAIGCDPMTLSDVWRGVHYPSSKVVARLIVVSGIPFDELFYIDASDAPQSEWAERRHRKSRAVA